MLNLDMDLLRSLTLAIDLGSFARAAERVGRTQSALSLQMRKLEDQAGQPLFRKQGRSLALTESGELLLGYARRLLDLNDEAVAAVRGRALEGEVRLGLPADFAENWLPLVLARFARAHPAVRIDVRVGRNAGMIEKVLRDELDLALAFSDADSPRVSGAVETHIGELPMAWIGPDGFAPPAEGPLPLILFDQPCVFRRAGLDALDRAGKSWRVTFTSPSLAGIYAAAQAGLGVSIRTGANLPKGLRTLGPADGMPALPNISLSLYGGVDPCPAVTELRGILIDAVRSGLAAR